eukprot:scaffold4668_cov113-Isochrysis_galbana.AAC.5
MGSRVSGEGRVCESEGTGGVGLHADSGLHSRRLAARLGDETDPPAEDLPRALQDCVLLGGHLIVHHRNLDGRSQGVGGQGRPAVQQRPEGVQQVLCSR